MDLLWITTFVNIKKFMNLLKFPENLKKSEHKILKNNIWSCFFLNYVAGYVTGLAPVSNVYFIFAKGSHKPVLFFLRMSPRKEMSQVSFFVKWAKNCKISKHLYTRKHVHLRYFSIHANSIEINIILLINIKLLRHKAYRKKSFIRKLKSWGRWSRYCYLRHFCWTNSISLIRLLH